MLLIPHHSDERSVKLKYHSMYRFSIQKISAKRIIFSILFEGNFSSISHRIKNKLIDGEKKTDCQTYPAGIWSHQLDNNKVIQRTEKKSWLRFSEVECSTMAMHSSLHQQNNSFTLFMRNEITETPWLRWKFPIWLKLFSLKITR